MMEHVSRHRHLDHCPTQLPRCLELSQSGPSQQQRRRNRERNHRKHVYVPSKERTNLTHIIPPSSISDFAHINILEGTRLNAILTLAVRMLHILDHLAMRFEKVSMGSPSVLQQY